jgi:tetratricopeptide (TPR) repeat protein
MGEVYEAEDLELRENVAVKTVRLDQGDPQALDRFRREVQLARRITHPNVCRVFDVFKAAGTDNSHERLFVTMQLLSGRTLAARIVDAGRLPASEACDIAKQIATAVQAAHSAGVVHRDLKPSNVMLLSGDPESLKVVVTDFGIATTLPGTVARWDVTQTGQFVGSPAYMAPEQVLGVPATPQTDVYALGVVLYEMVCGVPPFRAETLLASASQRLTGTPEDPRTHAPDLPPWLAPVIMKCLARDAAQRFGSMTDVLDALAAGHPRSRRALFWPAMLAVAGLSALAGWIGYQQWQSRPISTVHPDRPAVALLGFTNMSGRDDVAYVSTALAAGLGSALSSAREIRVVSGEDAFRSRTELGVSAPHDLSSALVRAIRRNLEADYIVAGSYTAQRQAGGREILVDINVHDARSGASLGRISRMGRESDLLALVAAAAADLRDRLGIPTSVDDTLRRARASLPSSEEPRRAYAEGLAALERSDARTARDRFEYAIAQEPDFALAHLQLSAAYAVLGFDGQAMTQADAALELSGALPVEERRWVEARHHEVYRNWDKAIAQYDALFRDFPDEIDYGIRLADSQVAGGRPDDAFRTLERLKTLAPSDDVDPRILISEASAAQAQGDAKRQAQAALLAMQAAERRGAPLLVARAALSRGYALEVLEDRQAAMETNERARLLYQQAGDRRGVARALINIGGLLHDEGESARAEKSLRTALSISRELGTHIQIAQSLNDLAFVLVQRGDFVGAAQMYDEALELSREVGNKNAEARALGNKAAVLYEQENVSAALQLNEESLRIKRDLGNERAVAFSLLNMGDMATELGKLDAAAKMYEEARAIAARLGDKEDLSFALSGLGQVAAYSGDLSRARTLVEEAIDLRRDLQPATLVAQAKVGLAGILLHQGELDAAADLLRNLVSLSSTQVDASTRTQARALLCLVRLKRGDNQAALNTLGTLSADERQSSTMAARYQFDIAAGLAAGANGNERRAIQMLAALYQRARKASLKTYELQSGLALAQVEAIASPVAGRRRASTLQREAAASGFKLFAR